MNLHITPWLLALAAGGLCAPTALAQYGENNQPRDERDRTRQVDDDQEHYEYEPDEGVHEEEWYDPSDWFDDDFNGASVDYESDWYEYSYNYDNDWGWNGSDGIDYDAYFDGYHDGYHDDEYGYDFWDSGWSDDYENIYTTGYYDGYYDKQNQYTYQPYYYITTYTVQGEQPDNRRAQDTQRTRGDRMPAGRTGDRQAMDTTRGRLNQDGSVPRDRVGRGGEGQQRQRMDAWAQRQMQMQRHRGTIQKIEQAQGAGVPQDHTALKLTMDDGTTVIADFGPNAKRENLKLKEGERVTLVGKTVSKDGTEVLQVQKLGHGDRAATLRGPGRDSYQNAPEGERVSITGKVTDVRRAKEDVQGQALYRVDFEDGRNVILAVKGGQADALQMREGDRITIEGRQTRMAEQRVIEVARISGRGQTAQK